MKKGAVSNENEELDGFLKKKSIFSTKESTPEKFSERDQIKESSKKISATKKEINKNQVPLLKETNNQNISSQNTSSLPSSGILYIVSTPIGNLEDITLRALRILKEADIVACEDTRTTGHLLTHYGIEAKGLTSYHSHSDTKKAESIITKLLEGKNIAVVSDAGTPGISDPAYGLVQLAIQAGIIVCPIPGASAILSFLVASGLPTHHFTYLGFLPVKKGRKTLFESLVVRTETVVFYESVHRIERTLEDIAEYLGNDTEIVIGRELTKKFETIVRGSVGDFVAKNLPLEMKGEFVVGIVPNG